MLAHRNIPEARSHYQRAPEDHRGDTLDEITEDEAGTLLQPEGIAVLTKRSHWPVEKMSYRPSVLRAAGESRCR